MSFLDVELSKAVGAIEEPNLPKDIQEGPGGTSVPLDGLLRGAVSPGPEFDSPAFNDALSKTPEQEVQIRDDARIIGVPDEVIRNAPEEAESEAQKRRIEEQTREAPLTRRALTDPELAPLVVDDVESLSAWERISRRFTAGVKTRELGLVGNQLRKNPGDQVILDRSRRLQEELAALGHEAGGGFFRFLEGTAEVLGQQASSFSDPEAAALIGSGGAAGTLTGLAGGPFAPVTSAAGAVAGLAAGATSWFAADSFQVETGHAYLEQIDEGIDPDVAKLSATVVGTLNAGLELTGASFLLAPLNAARKKLFREGIKKAVRSPALRAMIADGAKVWAASVGGEVATEVLQEGVNIIATEISKEFSEGDFESITPEEIAERLGGIAVKTFEGVFLLGGGGAAVKLASDIKTNRDAVKDAETMDELAASVQKSKVAQRTPDVAAAQVSEVLEQNAGIDRIFVSGEALLDQYTSNSEVQAFVEDMGLVEALENAYETGGDVQLSPSQYAEGVLAREGVYSSLKDHTRFGDNVPTRQEAMEAEPFADLTGRPVNSAPDLAEQEMGLKALFETADEAGMTPTQYAGYLAAVDKAANMTRNRQQAKELKAQKNKLTEQYKQQQEIAREDARAELEGQPVFEVLNSLPANRLDRAAVEALLPNGEQQLRELPTAHKQKIYSNKGRPGQDPEMLAEVYGFADAQHMLFSLIDAGDLETAVQTRSDQIMAERFPDISNQKIALDEAIQSLLHDQQQEVIAAEVNALRQAEGQRRVSAAAMRRAVKDQVSKMRVSELEPTALLNSAKQAAKKAGLLLRKGDRQGAAQSKLRQMKAFSAAQEAYRLRAKLEKQTKFLRQFQGNSKQIGSLPAEYLDVIRDALDDMSFGRRFTPQTEQTARNNAAERAKKLRAFGKRKLAEGVVVDTEKMLEVERRRTNYRDMTLEEFTTVYNSIRGFYKTGISEAKLARDTKAGVVDEAASEVVQGLVSNVDPRDVPVAVTTLFDSLKKGTREYANLILNPDTILKELDGWGDTGPAYRNFKRPYDRAYASGYLPGQMGYAARTQQEAEALTRLSDIFTPKERGRMRNTFRIPGVQKKMSHASVLSVLLNSGNADNKIALLNEFSEAEVAAIHEYATEKDWKFAQATWDYLDSFWEEVQQATVRRKNYRPEKVQAEPIRTKYGEFRGGYYPIRYDTNKGVVRDSGDIDVVTMRVRRGDFVASHTKDGHTRERQGSGDRKLLLDPFVTNSHVDQVVYDLEMGDAVNDIFKVLNHDEVKGAFGQMGLMPEYKALELWVEDAIAGEMNMGGVVEHAFRHVRAGFTISKLGWNLQTILMQPLGLLQSATLVGKKNMVRGVMEFMKNPLALNDFANDVSGLMRERNENFQKDITLAKKQLSQGRLKSEILARTPEALGPAADKGMALLQASMFYGIKKMQRAVDLITFNAALRDAQTKPNLKTPQERVEYAERIVARTQASGIFGDRSAFERGTLSPRFKQSEFVRAFTPLISYFMAKNNIAYERTKQTNFRSPGQVLGWATDMALLFTLEAVVAETIRGQFPDDEDDESVAGFAALGTAKSVVAGVPLLREVFSEVEGFRGGGTIAGMLQEIGKLSKQIPQGEVDEALVKSATRLGGILFHFPTSQPLNTGTAISREMDGENLDYWEFITGPRYED